MALGPENARAKHNQNVVRGGQILDGLISCEEGRILTADQLKELRIAWEALRGYRNFDGYARPHVNRLVEVVGSLLPATEPANTEFTECCGTWVGDPDPACPECGITCATFVSIAGDVEPVSEIPYDEMRALLGLPDVSDYVMRRDLARAFRNVRTAFGGFAEVLVEAGQQFARNLESFTEALAGSQSNPTPPMWAVDINRSGRRRNQ